MELFREFFISLMHQWSEALHTPDYVRNLLFALAFFALAIYLEIVGSTHTKKHVVNAPSLCDAILDRIPFVNLNFLYVETMGTLMTVFGLYQLAHPKTMPFVFATLALFTLIRRAFLVVTPFGAHKNHPKVFGFKPHRLIAQKLFQGDGDFFFSGHTGLPFLFFLLTPWQPLAIIFLIGAAVMGIAVLLMHVHYSIDVLAAPFMAYAIFALSRFMFV